MAEIVFHAHDAEELRVITRHVHDRWFDIDAVTHDHASGTVSARLVQPGHPDLLLEIGAVQSMDLEDSEQIGRYDINRVVIRGDRVVVDTGIPMRFEMKVSAVNVRLSAP